MYFGEWKAESTTGTDLPHVLVKDKWSVRKMVKLVNMALESGSINLQSNDQGRERGMKKRWEAPRLEVEQFMTNDSVSACGDSGRIYSFECNAGQAGNDYAVYSLDEWGKNYWVGPFYMDGSWGRYHPCRETHSAPDNSDFFTGYYIDDVGTRWIDERIPVVVWTNNGTDVHCTTNLNMNEWEVNRS